MAFNKARALEEAESLAIQGKISQAITRYFNIFEKDPSELILLNTIGDLYIRDRNISEGLKQFYRLAEAYVQGGYTLKAIAIYKKIVKLEPDSVGPLLKLVDLYQSQRLVREARELYYQVAECYKKKKQNDQALETLRKAVQLDFENPAARTRLVAFCEEIGRKGEAAQVYIEVAQLALRRGNTGAAQIALKMAQDFAPDDPQVRLLLAREALALKRPEDVAAILSGTPGLMKDPAGRSLLIESYFAMQQPEKAETLVLEAFRATPADFSPLASFVSACVQLERFDAASKALSTVAEELIAQGNTSSLMESLRLIRSKSPRHLPTLELILRIWEAGGDEDIPLEILEALGQGYLQCGQFKKAEQLFQRLVDREPLNEHYKDLLGQVLQEQGEEFGNEHVAELPSSGIELPEEEAAVPPVSPLHAGDRAALVREALENSELYARYHLVRKAVAELDRVLEIYPDETEIHKRLVGMCWKDLPERAEQAAQALAKIYAQQGDAEGAKRFVRIAGGGEAAATMGVPLQSVSAQPGRPEPSPALPAQPAGIPADGIDLASESSLTAVQEVQGISPNLSNPPASQALSPAGFESPSDFGLLTPSTISTGVSSEIQEIDLSKDWESFLAQRATSSLGPQAPPKGLSLNYDESRIEINFYLEHGFFEEANGAVKELERMLPGDPRIAELRALVNAHVGAPAEEAPEKESPKALEATPEQVVALPGEETLVGGAFSSGKAAPELEAKPAAGLPFPLREEKAPTEATAGWAVETSTDLFGDFAEGLESGMGKLAAPAPLPASPSASQAGLARALEAGIRTEAAPAASVEASANLLGDFSEAFESAMGRLEGSPFPPSRTSAPTAPVIPRAHSEERDEAVQEPSPEDDAEAHYNLGVAYWEMNLPDEAIRELQQVVKGAGTGPHPPNYLQACTLLATCFMEKGMASVAVKWYGRALETPHLDEEAWLALHYDLGVAYERAGDLPRALEEFSEVYGRDIAYRDVAEKVRTFRQKASSG